MRVDILEGPRLDYWVARAEGYEFVRKDLGRIQIVRDGTHRLCHVSEPPLDHDYSPSTLWEHGGPLIEREEIGTWVRSDGSWGATDYKASLPHYGTGPTLLIAAMRCLCASKFGEEVPDQE